MCVCGRGLCLMSNVSWDHTASLFDHRGLNPPRSPPVLGIQPGSADFSVVLFHLHLLCSCPGGCRQRSYYKQANLRVAGGGSALCGNPPPPATGNAIRARLTRSHDVSAVWPLTSERRTTADQSRTPDSHFLLNTC